MARHHQYYKYGERRRTWTMTYYPKVWFWESEETLPVSYNHFAGYHGIPDEKISEDKLESFKENATPITKEEYDSHIQSAKSEHQSEDDYEYYFSAKPGEPYDD